LPGKEYHPPEKKLREKGPASLKRIRGKDSKEEKTSKK